jgi:streptomycin 6-kinase
VPFQGIPDVPRRRALECGASAWLNELPELVEALEREWSIVVGRTFTAGTGAFVAEATGARDGTPSVLKLLIPGAELPAQARNEIAALRLANGEGCARLIHADEARAAILLERLGPSLAELDLPSEPRNTILCGVLARLWRPAAGHGFTTGAEKGAWLIDFVSREWDALDRPCSERAVDYALACARRRVAAHDDERSMLVHGDVHAVNTLRALDRDEYKLVDPDGLFAEPEYDLGILVREERDPRTHARWLAAHTGRDETAIWEWGFVERVSTGLTCARLELQPAARELLGDADRLALRPSAEP